MALYIYGTVGNWWDGLSTDDIRRALSEEEEEEDLDVFINSPGGDVFTGIAIMSLLRRHKGRVTAHIDGLAASAATIVMLGADEVVMPENAMIMIHNPWMMTAGDYREMAKSAEDLEKIRDSMVAAYKEKTGLDEEELKALLDDETWMTAEEALAHGLVDKIGSQVNAALFADRLGMLDLEKFTETPKALADAARAGRRNIAAVAAKGERMTKVKQVAARPSDGEHVAESTPVEERPTIEQIEALCARGSLGADDVLNVYKRAASMEQARDLVIDMMAAQSHTPTMTGVSSHSVVAGEDSRDKFKAAAADAILMRGSIKSHDTQNPYRGMTLLRLAEEAVVQAGGRPDYTDREALVKQSLGIKALGGNSRSDFPEILKDSTNKSVLIGHEQAGETWQQWTRTKGLGDFREASLVGLSAFDKLQKVSENGEYTHGSISERGEKIQLAKYGKLLRISYETLVDDDLDALTDAPRKMGIMAAQMPGDLAYAVLTDNPTMHETGNALFSAGHGNTFSDVLGYDGLDALTTAMMSQVFTSPDGSQKRLNITPQFLIVPPQLATAAAQLMASVLTGEDNQSNVFANRFQVIVDNRLGDFPTRWYLAANPMINDTVVVGFLDGNPTPFVAQKELWNVDAIEYKIRLECAAAASGYRGLARGGDGS